MSGGNGLFKPTGNITREQVVTTLYNLEKSPKVDDYSAVDAFKDVAAGEWYVEAVSWAFNTGVAQGNPQTKMFGVGTPITREQLVTMLYNYSEKKGYDVETRGDYSDLADEDAVSTWYVDAMKWGYGVGLIGGNGKLNPQGYTTRAQMASMMKQFNENVVQE